MRFGTIVAVAGGGLVIACSLAAVTAIFVPLPNPVGDATTIAILVGYIVAFAILTIAAFAVTVDFFHLTRKKEKVPLQSQIRLTWVMLLMGTGALVENLFLAARVANAGPWARFAIILLGIGALLGVAGLIGQYISRSRSSARHD